MHISPLYRSFPKLARAIATSSVALSLMVAAGPNVIAAPTSSLYAGYTGVALDGGFSSALRSLNVSLGTLPRTYSHEGAVYFPIASGNIDLANAKGEINHVGGLTLTAGGTRVELSDFAIDTIVPGKPSLTGMVVVNDAVVDRIPLFDITLPPGFSVPLVIDKRVLRLNDVGLKLSADAAAALNSVFKVQAFSAGLAIGKVSVKGYTIREH